MRDDPRIIVWVSVIVIGTMLIASWHKSSQLRAGGARGRAPSAACR